MRYGAQLEQRIRAGVVCVHDSPSGPALLCIRMRDPSSGMLRILPPGGGVQPGETPRQAAVREAFEETGYRVALRDAAAQVARYPYTWDGVLRAITTHFFRAALLDDAARPAPIHEPSFNEGVVWLPVAELDRELSFEPVILEAVRALL